MKDHTHVSPSETLISVTANPADIVAQMTLEEKASLCSGLDFWHSKPVERLGVPSFTLTDGPHGLRKQEEKADHLGINQSVPATCFPLSCATACSFDRTLLRQIGTAIGKECRQENVSVLLGPGLNIKRSPLCGRNFEYFSEDPLLSGEMAAALIEGVQGQNVSACPKHFALNNQETKRMVTDSVVDERAKREIYYGSFERAVRDSDPWAIMCSYNKIDGTYACENAEILTHSLREEWGFNGVVVTDWGAMDNRVEAAKAGLDLQMPTDGGYGDTLLVKAVRDRSLDETVLDSLAERIVVLAQRSVKNLQEQVRYDAEEHHAIARNAAAQSCVLLKNESGLLPLPADARIAVIGQFAQTPRYQGAGSSIINPLRMESVVDALEDRGITFEYAEGYSLDTWSEPDVDRIEEACRIAQNKEAVLLFAGLPAEYESEGFDRKTLDMPESHNQLIKAVCAVNPRTVVILQLGAPVVMPWQDQVPGILLSYLGGQAGGGGCVDVLLGAVNPCGHLSESWPFALADTPCAHYFPGNPKTVEYRESIFVGYRFYDAAERAVAWPFGHGLSYTDFSYSDLRLERTSFKPGEKLKVSFTVTNIGSVAGADVAQLYIGKKESALMRAPKELKGFEKIHVEPGESKVVCIELDDRSFAYFNTPAAQWAIEEGEYQVSVGTSSSEILLTALLQVEGDGLEAELVALHLKAPEYFDLMQGAVTQEGFTIPDSSFEALLGRPIPPTHRLPGAPFTVNSTLGDAQDTLIGKIMISQAKKRAQKMLGDNDALQDMMQDMLLEMPLRAMGMVSNGTLDYLQVEGLVDILNGKLIKGLGKLRQRLPREQRSQRAF